MRTRCRKPWRPLQQRRGPAVAAATTQRPRSGLHDHAEAPRWPLRPHGGPAMAAATTHRPCSGGHDDTEATAASRNPTTASRPRDAGIYRCQTASETVKFAHIARHRLRFKTIANILSKITETNYSLKE